MTSSSEDAIGQDIHHMHIQSTTTMRPDGAAILPSVVATIESLVQDWDLGEPVTATTRLVADLGFESIDLIQMVAALEQDFGRPDVSFAELLIVEGRYVDDLTVGQVAEAIAARA